MDRHREPLPSPSSSSQPLYTQAQDVYGLKDDANDISIPHGKRAFTSSSASAPESAFAPASQPHLSTSNGDVSHFEDIMETTGDESGVTPFASLGPDGGVPSGADEGALNGSEGSGILPGVSSSPQQQQQQQKDDLIPAAVEGVAPSGDAPLGLDALPYTLPLSGLPADPTEPMPHGGFPDHSLTERSLTSALTLTPFHPDIPRSGLVYDSRMMLHAPPLEEEHHPEEPDRIWVIFDLLKRNGCAQRMKRIQIREVTREEVEMVHSKQLWEKVESTALMSRIDLIANQPFYEAASLYINEATATCARLSCGGVIEMCDAVARGEVQNGFAVVRPPGHHAEPEESMGFCLYNNVSVAIRVLKERYPDKIKRVLILDWDVHHGNGTQKAFWADPDVLYMSLHRYDNGTFYPSTTFGGADMAGVGSGEGFCVNVPWPHEGMGDGDYIYAFQQIIMPIAYEFAPDMVIISAGFDAAERDTLGGCKVTPAGYSHMTHMLSSLAKGKLVISLEGGYNLEAIATSALACTRVLLGEPPEEVGPGHFVASAAGTETVHQVALVQDRYWKCIDAKALEPKELVEARSDGTVWTLPDLLKAHRADHLFQKYRMQEIPIVDDGLCASFYGQVLCTEDPYSAKTLFVFIHDLGSIRAERPALTTNIQFEKSYMIDTSSSLIDWIRATGGWELIDVNIHAHLPVAAPLIPAPRAKRSPKQNAMRDLALYVWDNYVELSDAEQVVLIGHGSGCAAVMDIVNERAVMSKVVGVIQVLGQNTIPLVQRDRDQLKRWYYTHSKVICPRDHPLYVFEEQARFGRRLGKTERSEEPSALRLLRASLPAIEEYVTGLLSSSTAAAAAATAAATGSGESAGVVHGLKPGPSNGVVETVSPMDTNPTLALGPSTAMIA